MVKECSECGKRMYKRKIALCFKCHDEVEILTDDLFNSGKRYDSYTLRQFITQKAFPVKAGE